MASIDLPLLDKYITVDDIESKGDFQFIHSPIPFYPILSSSYSRRNLDHLTRLRKNYQWRRRDTGRSLGELGGEICGRGEWVVGMEYRWEIEAAKG